MKKQFACPIQQVALAGIPLRGSLKFVGRSHEVPVFFFDLTQQVVQFRSIFLFQKVLHQLAGIAATVSEQVGERQVIPVIVGSGIDSLSLCEKRYRLIQLSSANIKFSQIMVGSKVTGFEFDGLVELHFRWSKLS